MVCLLVLVTSIYYYYFPIMFIFITENTVIINLHLNFFQSTRYLDPANIFQGEVEESYERVIKCIETLEYFGYVATNITFRYT